MYNCGSSGFGKDEPSGTLSKRHDSSGKTVVPVGSDQMNHQLNYMTLISFYLGSSLPSPLEPLLNLNKCATRIVLLEFKMVHLC